MPKMKPEEIKPGLTLEQVLPIVTASIQGYRDELTKLIESNENDPVLVEGATSTGHFVHLMVDPKEVATTFLQWDYPMYKILEEEAPQGMWDTLAEQFGLESVCSVDL